jgi:ferredoxin
VGVGIAVDISVDTTKCAGHGRCYTLAPDLFDMDDDGRGVADHVPVPPGQEAHAEDALLNCPERAVIRNA